MRAFYIVQDFTVLLWSDLWRGFGEYREPILRAPTLSMSSTRIARAAKAMARALVRALNILGESSQSSRYHLTIVSKRIPSKETSSPPLGISNSNDSISPKAAASAYLEHTRWWPLLLWSWSLCPFRWTVNASSSSSSHGYSGIIESSSGCYGLCIRSYHHGASDYLIRFFTGDVKDKVVTRHEPQYNLILESLNST